MENTKSVQFVPLGKLFLEDSEEVKKIKSLYKRESEYADILGGIEFSIANFFFENRDLKDKDVVKAIKKIKSNYYRELEYFKEAIGEAIMIASSAALQKRKITKHEYFLALGYILWSISNRKWLPGPRGYLEWLLRFFNIISSDKESEQLDIYSIVAGMVTPGEEEIIMKESEHFAISEDES